MKDLNIKNFINVLICVWFNFWPSDHLKFILKYFEIILINGPFIIPLVKSLFFINDSHILVKRFV